MNLLGLKNWVRFHILGKNPVCPECGAEMVQRGFPRDFVIHFKCLECGYGSGLVKKEAGSDAE